MMEYKNILEISLPQNRDIGEKTGPPWGRRRLAGMIPVGLVNFRRQNKTRGVGGGNRGFPPLLKGSGGTEFSASGSRPQTFRPVGVGGAAPRAPIFCQKNFCCKGGHRTKKTLGGWPGIGVVFAFGLSGVSHCGRGGEKGRFTRFVYASCRAPGVFYAILV